jgi:hypothetical protein
MVFLLFKFCISFKRTPQTSNVLETGDTFYANDVECIGASTWVSGVRMLRCSDAEFRLLLVTPNPFTDFHPESNSLSI